ncbi:ANTAR domain-containing protein [Gaiella sp.]|uniref:ANTAR domain-containing response regulator n=1 Tax=Gaiella sp. TaxID=2663207 RepID=UPI0032649C50
MVDDTERSHETPHLRILIANERAERLERVASVVLAMGHTVIARELDVQEVGQVTREERPDVALVGLGEDSEHALDHISRIVREATCPVIALLHVDDSVFINEAAKRGIFAYITDGDASEIQSAIDIVLRRFAEYHNLEGAFGRRSVIERAKGILMERHGLPDQRAFELLRDHSQHNGRKVFDIAQAILDSHLLLSSPLASDGETQK